MGIGDELNQLGELHQRGVLSDAEFGHAKARVLGATGSDPRQPALGALHRLRRVRSDRWLGGVCSGLAEWLGTAPWVLRLAFLLLALCAGTGFMAYLLLWIFVPEEDAALAAGRGHFHTA